MNNIKFNEFIIANEKFYNLLSDKNKELISDLDEYNMNLSLLHDEAVYIDNKYSNDIIDPGQYDIYIGKKNNNFYYYKVTYFKKKIYISSGILIIKKEYKQLKGLI